MARFAFPALKALIFDMDGTLYYNPKLDQWYERSFYQLIAQQKKMSLGESRRVFDVEQAAWAERLGYQPSKLFTLAQLGISDQRWAKTTGRIPVAKVLRPDPRLRAALKKLSQVFRIGLVTNNHRHNTQATLHALQLEDVFDEILTLSESRRFKPAPELYQTMADALAVDPKACLAIGDRYALDLAPAAEIGMQTLLVHRPEELYGLGNHLQVHLARRLPARTSLQRRHIITEVARCLRAGRLVVLPTDTVYGLAAIPELEAVRWIYRAKGRPDNNPLVLLLSDPEQAEKYVRLSSRARLLMQQHWPGGLTLVLPTRPGTAWGKITHGGRRVAIRVPDHDFVRSVIRASGGALATSSANLSGGAAQADPHQLDPILLGFAELWVDAGKAKSGVPSTVAALEGSKVRILRYGGVCLDY